MCLPNCIPAMGKQKQKAYAKFHLTIHQQHNSVFETKERDGQPPHSSSITTLFIMLSSILW
jgi:hypothetical protein